MPETVTTRVDPATDYRHRLTVVEDALARPDGVDHGPPAPEASLAASRRVFP